MCARCDELAAELRRQHAIASASVKLLDGLLEIAERPDTDPIVGDEFDEDDPIALMERNLEADDDEPEEPTSLDSPHQPSANGQPKPRTAAAVTVRSEREDELQRLAEKCPGILRQSKSGQLLHMQLRMNLGGEVHHKTGDAAIRRALDQKLIVTQKIDGLQYYVLP